ncbi:hypothetical protein [Luteimicrobium subarcticum]|uniref:hypothetical protein n=1 Tax=Luteimicrobium subarcticum TaxID=620910 RepID=UPI0012FE780A|nr:hypothetical protein [Luteimicrobium subarcticum]
MDLEDDSFASLEEALRDRRVPVENWDVIRRVVTAIGVGSYRRASAGVRADRLDGGPHLIIAYGWTNGFRTSDEAATASGGMAAVYESRSRRGSGRWGIEHPVNKIRAGGEERSRNAEPIDPETCPVCHLAYSATGACGCD